VSRPTLPQARDWQPASLAGLADSWSTTATRLSDETDDLPGELVETGWGGDAADSFRDRLTTVVRLGTDTARALIAGAAAARDGSASLGAARQRVLDLVAEAARQGYGVSDDGTISAPADPGALLSTLAGGAGAVALTSVRATQLSGELEVALTTLGAADADAAADIRAAFAKTADPPGTSALEDVTVEWPRMGQPAIAAQIAAMTTEQRAQLVRARPVEVGNTDGVPWETRVAANRINIADAILDERATLTLGDAAKVDSVLTERFGEVGAEMLRWATLANPGERGRVLAEHDRKAKQRIDFYQGLLAEVPDGTGRTDRRVQRQILGFDTRRSQLIELTGDLSTATSVGVLIPGLNTTVLGSGANTETARRFVAAGRGKVAMITYLGGEFPAGPHIIGVADAANPRYAQEMAPRLVAFSEDVDRRANAAGRPISVTYLGHSYGGSILGTAERLGLTADRTVYVEAAGTGVAVDQPGDWHNRNPRVERFAMTAPLDPIGLIQGQPLGVHGADPDVMPGVTRLDTGRRLDGSPMSGLSAHGDVLNEPSDAWHNLYAVITGNHAQIKVAR
jgi:Alpha/beta hydrolase